MQIKISKIRKTFNGSHNAMLIAVRTEGTRLYAKSIMFKQTNVIIGDYFLLCFKVFDFTSLQDYGIFMRCFGSTRTNLFFEI